MLLEVPSKLSWPRVKESVSNYAYHIQLMVPGMEYNH